MEKFQITEVQIDKFNDTYNKLYKFKLGLNVIIGENEAGKTTLMNFITNIFKQKSDAQGYLKGNCNDLTLHLDAKKSKQKENLQYLEKLTSKNFEQGFFIDLDDLAKIDTKESEKMIDIIKDSSGEKINEKQEYYNKKIHNSCALSLTNANKASVNFKKSFEDLEKLEAEIKESQSLEGQYNQKCIELKTLENQSEELKNKIKYIELALKLNQLKTQISNLNLNETLLENRQEWTQIREMFYSVKSDFVNLAERKMKYDGFVSEKDSQISELNKFENLTQEQIENFDGSKLSQAQNILTSISDVARNNEFLKEKINEKQSQKEKIQIEIEQQQKVLTGLEIDDINEFEDDKSILKKYLETYNQFREKEYSTSKNKSANDFSVLKPLFGLFILLFGFGTWIYHLNTMFSFGVLGFAILGFAICFFEYKKKADLTTNLGSETEDYKTQMAKILNKYRIDISKDIPIVASLEIDKMGSKIEKYNSGVEQKTRLENDLAQNRVELENLKSKLDENMLRLSDYEKEKEEFLKSNYLSRLENYAEVSNLIRNIKDLSVKISDYESFRQEYDKKVSEFVEKVNDFLQKTQLKSIMPICKDEFENFESVISNIQQEFDENLKNSTNQKMWQEDIEKLTCEIKTLEDFEGGQNLDEFELNELERDLKETENDIAVTKNDILQLSKVENLVDLKNRKNAELNRLKKALGQLFINEVVYETILNSKEEFNKIQPNLVSAKNYLNLLTNGKYDQINFEEMTISSENTAEKKWSELSRGTKEQLYLALRLGYAQNYSFDKNGEYNAHPMMPLIIDDAFVNFDVNRTACALKCLEEFAKKNQVLYFSCHGDYIKNLLSQQEIEYNLIEL